MEEVYDLHQHTHCVIFYFSYTSITTVLYSTSKRNSVFSSFNMTYGTSIIYDKQKLNVLHWGYQSFENNKEDTVKIDVSRERLYELFKKGKDRWDQDDLFLLTAVSTFIRLSVEEIIKNPEEKIKTYDALHYVFVVPSEWEEEIREVLIRLIFVQANLISNDDYQDRLLFCSDVESICYYLSNPNRGYCVTMARNVILGRIAAVGKCQISIELYLISIENPLFDFSGSVVFPTIINSNSLSFTTDDVKNGIREFIKTRFSFDAQEDTIQNAMKTLDYNYFKRMGDEDEVDYLMKPFIFDECISELDKHQEANIKSIRIFDVCEEISKRLPNNLKYLLQSNLVKEYSVMKFFDKYSSGIELNNTLVNWSRYLFEYNRISFGSKNIVPENIKPNKIDCKDVLNGAARYMFDAVQNSDIYSKPRILSAEHLATSFSVFLNSKPDAIMSIDISLESIELSFSLLDENGIVNEIWNHDCFAPYISLGSLGSFFNFSEVVTLNVKISFIPFFDKYFTKDSDILSSDGDDILTKDMILEIEDILNVESYNEGLLVSTQQQIYIKAFLLTYMKYINYIASRKLPTTTRSNDNIKIGYAITVENILLKRLFGTEDDLRNVIYASNLVHKDNSFKKLRITIQGEGLLPVIQQSLNLQFPIKSLFVVAQLYEDYMQLTLNQVVTESGEKEKDQEAIILQDEIIPILNIYDSLCYKMWTKMIEDNGLIQLCDTHKGYSKNELPEIFSLENRTEFTNNLKEYIFKNILSENLTTLKTDATTIRLSTSCKCRVRLTSDDITEISFKPVLQYIISVVSTSLINKQLFGNYRNIRYMFYLIRFNYNPHFQHVLMKILNYETDYFLYEQRIGIAHYTIPKLSNQLVQPILQQEPFSYKAFLTGVLYHVYTENYGFGFKMPFNDGHLNFKNKTSDSKITSTNKETVFPLFIKGNKISKSQVNRVFYLNSEDQTLVYNLDIGYFRLKNTDFFELDKTVCVDDTLENIGGSNISFVPFYRGHYRPFIISVVYEGYKSSLSLVFKRSGDDIKWIKLVAFAEPMTLARF